MKIAICSSIIFAQKILDIKEKLEKLGHKVIIPHHTHEHARGLIKIEDKWEKIEEDVLKEYFKTIKKSEAILVLNLTKDKIKNYIGGNTLIEMAFAYVLNKKIYLLNPVPKMKYSDEIFAMRPKIIKKDLKKI